MKKLMVCSALGLMGAIVLFSTVSAWGGSAKPQQSIVGQVYSASTFESYIFNSDYFSNCKIPQVKFTPTYGDGLINMGYIDLTEIGVIFDDGETGEGSIDAFLEFRVADHIGHNDTYKVTGEAFTKKTFSGDTQSGLPRINGLDSMVKPLVGNFVKAGSKVVGIRSMSFSYQLSGGAQGSGSFTVTTHDGNGKYYDDIHIFFHGNGSGMNTSSIDTGHYFNPSN